MDALALLSGAAKFVLLLGGLLGPGAALMRALRIPVTVATSFAGSVVAIYTVILVLQLTRVPMALGTITCGLTAIAAACVAIAYRQSQQDKQGTNCDVVSGNRHLETAETTEVIQPRAELTFHRPTEVSTVLLFTLGMAIFWCVVLWRVWHAPLAGPDVEFRWSYLAEQMLRLGTLDFYPPRSASDFRNYFWAESIPPGAAALHAWAYACAGKAGALWTSPASTLQLWAIHEFVGRTAFRLGGTTAARFALLAVAACPLLTWAVLLGQETGLTALSLAGIAYALVGMAHTKWPSPSALKGVEMDVPLVAASVSERTKSTRSRSQLPSHRGAHRSFFDALLEPWQSRSAESALHASAWAALAGISATIGAAAREYGVVFPILAGVGLLLLRADRRTWLAFAAFAALSIVWPLRTWWLTGNPFYSLSAGPFPTNPRFIAWIEHDADALAAILRTSQGWTDAGRYLVLFAGTASAGGLILFFHALRGSSVARWGFGATLVIVTLWFASVRYTNGGLFYSMRVLAPALLLGTIVVALAIATYVGAFPRRRLALTAALGLWGLAMLPATLFLPKNPWGELFASPPESTAPFTEDPTVALIAKHGAKGVILADAPGYQRRFARLGAAVIPLWSPQANWLFDETLSPPEASRQWLESGVRYVVITKWQANLDFFNTRSRWGRSPFAVEMLGKTSTTAVFLIRADG